MQPSFQPNKTWILQRITAIDPGLKAVLTSGAHYVMSPAETMSFEDYKRRLTMLNTRTVRANQVNVTISESIAPERKSTHRNKSVRFICDALATVYHDHISIEDWDENDYEHIGQLVVALNAGEIELSEVTWSEGASVTKAHRFIAKAVRAFTKAERAKRQPKDEDEEAEMLDDHAVLTASLMLDEPENPLSSIN